MNIKCKEGRVWRILMRDFKILNGISKEKMV